MSAKLIQLNDDTLVEVSVEEDRAQPISGRFAEKVSATFEKIHPILLSTCQPIVAAWKELNQEISVDQAEVTLGLSFEGEGNLYITRSKAAANVTVKLILKPRNSADDG